MEWHPYAHTYPMIHGEEYAEFKEFIRLHPNRIEPVKVRILPDGSKQGIDGRTRVQACKDLGIDWPEVAVDLPDDEVEAYIDALNLNRRHLDKEFRRSRVKALATEGLSVREIAAEVEVSPSTVQRDIETIRNETDGRLVASVVFAENQQVNAGDEMIVTYTTTVSEPKLNEHPPRMTTEPSRDRDSFTKQNPRVKVAASKQNILDAPEPDLMTDDADYPIPAKLRSAFAIVGDLHGVEYRLNRIATDLANIEASTAYKLAATTSPDKMAYSTLLLTAAKKIRDLCPSVVHQDCKGEGCSRCKSKGFLTNSEAGHEDEA